jgi:TonB family protein
MTRGLPWSVLLHLVALGALAAWGGHVPQPPLEPHRVLKVQLARMPAAAPQVSQAAPEPEPEPVIPEVEPTPPSPPKEAVLPPKEIPEPVERTPDPPARTEPDPVPVKPDTEPAAQPDETPETDAPPVASGPASVSKTDVDFPFAWYLNSVEGIVARNWRPRQLGFREGSSRNCMVHFMIGRGGQISQVTLVRSSGVALFDREALRAVKSARLQPLPAKFPHQALGVTFVFTLESGI